MRRLITSTRKFLDRCKVIRKMPPALPVAGSSVQRQGNVLWLHGSHTQPCPVCSSCKGQKLVLSVPSLAPPHDPVIFAGCRQCGVRFVVDYRPVTYAAPEPDLASLHFYIEQGAGLEVLARSLFTAAQIPVHTYLDVGCGFGFGLDMATRIFGWDARGIDPGPLAACGRDLLGVRIDGDMLVPGQPRCDGPFDAIAAMEVVEHLAEPRGFLQAVRENLSPAGIFVLSTPNGRYVETCPDGDMLLPILSPGYHAILYTADALRLVLENAGFRRVNITESDTTLFAVATLSSEHTSLLPKMPDPDKYRAYLRSLYRDSPEGSPLHVGAGQRLLRRLTDDGMYREASSVFDEVRDGLASSMGLDLDRPLDIAARMVEDSVSFGEMPSKYPFCLGAILYAKARIEDSCGNKDRAALYFVAARIAADVTLKVLNNAGFSDGDTAVLTVLAAGGLKVLW